MNINYLVEQNCYFEALFQLQINYVHISIHSVKPCKNPIIYLVK